MIGRDDHFKFLQARIVCHRDAVMEEVRRSVDEKYVIRTVSPFQDESQDDLAVIRQYEMSLSELMQLLDEDRLSIQSEQIIRITPSTP